MRTDEIYLICGRRGSGKTTLLKELINDIPISRIRIWDPLNEFPAGYKPVRGDRVEFETFGATIWNTGNIFAVVDEADIVLPENFPVPDAWSRILNLGRHRNIGGIFVSRRIARLQKLIPSQAAHIYVFQQSLPNDIRYLKEFVGHEKANRISQLGQFEYLEVHL